MLDAKKVLAANLSALLDSRPDISRLDLSRQIKVADGSLGRIKYGTGNPTVETLEQIARFFKVETWQLLYPDLGKDRAQPPPVQQGETKLHGAAARIAQVAQSGGISAAMEKIFTDLVNQIEAEKTNWGSDERKTG